MPRPRPLHGKKMMGVHLNNALPTLGAGGGGCNRYIIMMITAAAVSMLFIVFNLYQNGLPADVNSSSSSKNAQVQQSYIDLLRYKEAQDYPKPKGNNYTGTNSDPLQDWRASHTLLHPGRFKQAEYNNMTVQVAYNANDNAQPHTRYDCAPGLVCNFSDKSWHETGWAMHNQFVSYPSAKQGVKNKVQVTAECPVLTRDWLDVQIPYDSNDDLAGIATTDFRSDIPTEYMSDFGTISDYYARPKSEGITKWKILYIQSNCNLVASGRGMVIRKLMERGLVDSYGKCNNNAAFPKGLGSDYEQQKDKMIQMYAFTAAFENSIYPGYATEKIWHPLWFGSVPIYLGAPNARSFLPENSTIFVDDFIIVDDLADYIEFLLTNREAYDFYHKWRHDTPPQHLVDLWKFSEQPLDCRLCRWGAENLH